MKPKLTQFDVQRELVYSAETGVFTNRIYRNARAKINAVAGYKNSLGYVVIQIAGQKVYAHRLAWLYMTGEWPQQEIDHINRQRNDNRFANLRSVTPTENKHNTAARVNNTSGVRGVVWVKNRNKWQAQISVAGKHRYLGLFADKDAAINARKTAAAKFHAFADCV